MKSQGFTPSERYLSFLAQKSFLSLWSFPNLFRENSKELSDLTIVCGSHVIIFSDKYISFHNDKNTDVAWQRWYNKAVNHSVKQLLRARGWIQNHRDRIFFDAKRQDPAEIFKNIQGEVDIHLVAVANGAARACINHFGGGSGSLIVRPSESQSSPAPFCVGNPGGTKAFVHVFDEINLNVILQELDTIADFLSYLRARQKLFERGRLIQAPSEEDLLAIFLKNVNDDGEHDFVFDGDDGKKEEPIFVIEEGTYLQYTKRHEYKRKKKADKKSYFWDRLIESFAKNLTSGALVPLPDELAKFDGRNGAAEIGLRYMALQPRILRRAHSDAILRAFDALKKSKGDRFFRAMLPLDTSHEKTGFFILLLNRKTSLNDWTYDDYRRYRAIVAHAYSENLLLRNRNLDRVVGIATEGEQGRGRSEDLIYQEQLDWTDESIAETQKLADAFDVFRSINERSYSAFEYPATDVGLRGSYPTVPYKFHASPERSMPMPLTGNRAQRRMQAARARKSRDT